MEKVSLYQEIDGTSHDIEIPPSSRVKIEDVRSALRLPEYVDLGPFVMERTAVSIWAALNAPMVLGDLAHRKKIDRPLSPLLIGGAAVKMLSRSANDPSTPFNRTIKDVDFVIPRDQGAKLVYLLTCLSSVAGTRYHYFLTKSDAMFNAMRAGERYRIRAVDWDPDDRPVVKGADILAERIEMRHAIDIGGQFPLSQQNRFTVGPEKLLVLKAQVITEMEREEGKVLQDAGQDFRVLPYEHYRSDRLLVGMEEKDALDVCGLLLDLGVGRGGIDPTILRRGVEGDQKLLLTLRLNLQNLARNRDWMRRRGISEDQVRLLGDSLASILDALPVVEKKWSKPWWNTDVETPVAG